MWVAELRAIRTSIRAANEADAATLASLCHPDFELVSVLASLDGRTYHGRDAWTSYFRDLRKTWIDWRFEDLEILQEAEGRFVTVFRIIGRRRSSGSPVEERIGATYEFRDGMIWRIRSYLVLRTGFDETGARMGALRPPTGRCWEPSRRRRRTTRRAPRWRRRARRT